MSNKLPSFGTIRVKVKAPGGFTFLDPSKPVTARGHPLRDEKGNSYTDKSGEVLLFRRTTLAQGFTGEIPRTPEVETGLKQEVRKGRRDPVTGMFDTTTLLVEIKPAVKSKPDPTILPADEGDDDKKKKPKGGK